MKTKKHELNIKKRIYYKQIRLTNIYYTLSRKIKVGDVSESFHSFSYENHRYAEGIKSELIHNKHSLWLLLKIYHQIDSHWVGLSTFYLGNTFLRYYLKSKEKRIISLSKLLSANDKSNTLFNEIKQCSENHIQIIDSFDRIK